MTITIANAAGFLGDNKMAPRRLVESATVDFLTLEYLAELTLSILAYQKTKNSSLGYASDLIDVIGDLTDPLRAQDQLHVVTNGGGMNPAACARTACKHLVKAGLDEMLVGVVDGDDVTTRLESLQNAGLPFNNLDTGEPLATLRQPIISANAYLGSEGIVEALDHGSRITITGRVADASLTVGPAMYRFGWSRTDWDRLARAVVAGHIIECGAQATGGYSTSWAPGQLGDVGYPIAEIAGDGNSVITKAHNSGGRVDRQTVVEQLVYEIGDPQHYLTPDVDADFSTVSVDEVGSDRVAISGAAGNPAPESLKVSLAYHDGYTAVAQLLVYGRDCLAKAAETAEIVLARVEQAGYKLNRSHVEFLGANQSVPGQMPTQDMREVVLRIAVHDERREAVQTFTEQVAPLVTSGPAGLAGYAAGRSRVRPVYAYWPTLIPRQHVQAKVVVQTAGKWAAES